MKTCTVCKIEKELIAFGKCKKTKDGLTYQCRECKSIKYSLYRKTILGLVNIIYENQKLSCISRKHEYPKYTRNELLNWVRGQYIFYELYNNRIESGYEKQYIPSIDRVCESKTYSFDNIQLMTWEENRAKFDKDMREGRIINIRRPQKPVTGIHIETGEVIKFHSMQEAQRKTGIHNTAISSCCMAKYGRTEAGGYKWSLS